MSHKILVADDEKRIRKIIGDYLKNDGYKVIEAQNGKEALEKFYSNNDIDLIILDVMMPKKDGWQVCKEIREEFVDVPIIFLTALGESHDEIQGLDLGADDYITKPFGYEVFMARIRSALRRKTDNNDIYRIRNLEVDDSSRIVKLDDETIEMSPKEYDLLLYLIKNKNIALKRDKILDVVWGYDFFGDSRTIDTHIKNIRAKLGNLGNNIKTVRGIGYKFEVK